MITQPNMSRDAETPLVLPSELASARAVKSFYTNKQPADERKLRGGYYTPLDLARYLVKWGMQDDTRRIMEPSCGDGNFLVALCEHLGRSSQADGKTPPDIVAVELNSNELAKAQARIGRVGASLANIQWVCQDFFEAYPELAIRGKFDLILGNPPFIRFQYFDERSRELAFEHLRWAGYRPTKLANSWVAFVELSIELLRDGGRLGMVVPAEMLQVNYAQQLRQRLAAQFERIVIVGFKKLVFPEIQQEVFLLLADGKRAPSPNPSDIYTLEIEDGGELPNLGGLIGSVAHVPAKHSRNGMKWTSLFIDKSAYEALDEAEKAPGLVSLVTLAAVDVGIVTGRNSFFVLNERQKDELQAAPLTVPMVGRTSAFKSSIFRQSDFEENKTQYPSFLLNLIGSNLDEFPLLREYIRLGEQEGIHRGYKCRIRKRWFDVPSIYAPDLFLFRQIHRYPLLVVNEAGATSSDTIHRVRLRHGVDKHKFATTFFNSLTLAWAEVCGRSYGGGVLELEPSEAEGLPMPYGGSVNIDAQKVESLLRTGKPYEALDYVDSVVLKGYIGFDQITVREIRRAWEQLRDRRIERCHKAKNEVTSSKLALV